MTVLFRTAAGPRIGFGHLVRAGVLRRALGEPAALCLRGGAAARRTARQFGWREANGVTPSTLRRDRAGLLVVDDPSAVAARPWVRAARRHGVPVASIHDLGIAPVASDLAIDGSIVVRPPARGSALVGTRYSIIDPRYVRARWRPSKGRPTVLIALGGGSHRRLADAIAAAIAQRAPHLRIDIAAGFSRSTRSLFHRLNSCSVALVGGGVTLYEACALGVPTVAVPVVRAQLPTILGFERHGAALRGGNGFGAKPDLARTVDMIMCALGAAERRRLSRTGRATVDGLGAVRVARALRALAERA